MKLLDTFWNVLEHEMHALEGAELETERQCHRSVVGDPVFEDVSQQGRFENLLAHVDFEIEVLAVREQARESLEEAIQVLALSEGKALPADLPLKALHLVRVNLVEGVGQGTILLLQPEDTGLALDALPLLELRQRVLAQDKKG